MWGVLIILNILSYGFITGHIHLQLDLDVMAKMVKLLAIYGAIPPRVWAEKDLQILIKPSKIHNRLWGL